MKSLHIVKEEIPFQAIANLGDCLALMKRYFLIFD
jgi:hypothetical protein